MTRTVMLSAEPRDFATSTRFWGTRFSAAVSIVPLACTIKDRIEAIDESIEFEKGFMKDLEDNPDYCKR